MPGASVAALWAAWEDEEYLSFGLASPVASGPAPPVTFPTTALVCGVYLAIGADLSASPLSWVWTDITQYVRFEPGITTTQGRADWTSTVRTSSGQLTLDNRDGRFSRRNPNSPYFGLLTFNTPIWATVDAGSGPSTRMAMFVNEWPTRWSDRSGTDSTVPIQCAGIMRRLQQGEVLKSALRRTIPTLAPAGYWPMEDGSLATTSASAVQGVANLTVNGTVSFAASAGPGGSGPLCGELASSTGSLTVPDILTGGSASNWSLFLVFQAVVNQTAILCEWSDPTSATDPYWIIVYDGPNHGIQVSSYLNGIQSTIAGFINPPMDSGFHTLIWRQAASGTRTLIVDGVTIPGTTPGASGPPRSMGIAPFRTNLYATPGNVSMGHVALWGNSTVDTSNLTWAMGGYVGELATARIKRLCAEEGIPIVIPSA